MVRDISCTSDVEITLACQTLQVSRSGYYAWLERPESERAVENTNLLIRIRSEFERSKKTYGSPRIAAALRSEGVVVSEKRVARIMRENEIASESVKKFKISTTDSKHNLPIADRIFETENVGDIIAPNQVWAGDITYVATEEGWIFLAVFLDIFTRKIVGFSSDDNMQSQLIINALDMALGRQNINDGKVVAHSDRGSQYASDIYQKKLELVLQQLSFSRC